MNRLLIAEDEDRLASFLEKGLRANGYATTRVADGMTAAAVASDEDFDLLVLDLGLPGMDGLEVLKDLRRRGKRLPVLILSARDDVADKVAGLELGADDYLSKPFRSDELLARIRAVMRRASASPASDSAGGSDWQLDLRRHEIRWRGQVLDATAIEFRLLRRMIEHLGEVVPHADLLAAGWPGVPDPDLLWLKPHLARLREKLDRLGAAKPSALRAVGYRLDPAGQPVTATARADGA